MSYNRWMPAECSTELYHHGVKGMKWGKHLFGKQENLKQETGGGGGGNEEDLELLEQLKEKFGEAKALQMFLELKQKAIDSGKTILDKMFGRGVSDTSIDTVSGVAPIEKHKTKKQDKHPWTTLPLERKAYIRRPKPDGTFETVTPSKGYLVEQKQLAAHKKASGDHYKNQKRRR